MVNENQVCENCRKRHDGSCETCKVCGRLVLIMVNIGTNICSENCRK